MRKILTGYWSFHPFTDDEAWLLFKLAAIGEAIGWTLLIAGILCQRYLTPHSDIPVQLAGHTHGILFLIYVTAVLVLSPSLRWPWHRIIVAGLASVPPYGSLLFEMWASHQRQKTNYTHLGSLLVYKALLAGQNTPN